MICPLVVDVVRTGRIGIVILPNETVFKIAARWRDTEASPQELRIEDHLVGNGCAFLDNEEHIY